mgnify:CR=1 FL=1
MQPLSRTFRKSLRPPFLLSALACVLASPAALAQQRTQDLSNAPSVYLQGGFGENSTDAVTLGLTLPWSTWRTQLWGGELRGHWDLYVSRWSFDGVGGNDNSLLWGVTPTLRLRPQDGRAAWFWEAGIGATLSNHRYRPLGEQEFSTRFNFASHIGLGINLGERRQHELLLRVQHLSNAGIKQPNPGVNFLQVRYGWHF